MKLSDGEKIILIMLTEIYQKLEIKGEIDPEFIKRAIFDNCTWGIAWQYTGIPFEKEDDPEIVSDVSDTLFMWDIIEASYEELSEEEKIIVEEKVKPLGKDPKFRGFDGNSESSALGVARFMINELGLFARFSGRDLNSHMPSIDANKRMYSVFEPILRDLMGKLLNVDQLTEILPERIHPENR